jgi:AcrR family transcriptional regulator
MPRSARSVRKRTLPAARQRTDVPARRRRDPETARSLILDAAEGQLITAGAAAIRLQEVAATAGVSHPTVLHYFGSREALVEAVIERSLDAMHARLVEAIGASTGREDQVVTMLEGVFDSLSRSGYGRVILWLALGGHPVEPREVSLSQVLAIAHRSRTARKESSGTTPSRRDTAHVILLCALTLTASTVLLPTLLESLGIGSSEKAKKRFLAWLGRLLAQHLGFETR